MPAETPSPLGAEVRAALAGTRFAEVRWVASTGSTNTDAMALARDGAPEGLVVVADHQRAGRGRLGRTWEAPSGASLLVSVLLRPPAAVLDLVTVAAGVAMVDAVAAVAGVTARLKWPNDLVVDIGGGVERKLAGMLAEADWPVGSSASGGYSAPDPAARVAVVVGIGVNVNWPAEVPDDLAGILTACNHVAGHEVDRGDLLVAFLVDLAARYGDLVAGGSTAGLLDEYRRRSATIGRRVRVDTGADELEGVAVDVDGHGRLVVEPDAGGPHRTVAVGDVVHLRHRAG